MGMVARMCKGCTRPPPFVKAAHGPLLQKRASSLASISHTRPETRVAQDNVQFIKASQITFNLTVHLINFHI